jgi:DNA-directed RNA polymerase specialized sigma24 family protein
MPTSGSVTHWIRMLEQGDDRAAQGLWERYFSRLVGLARQKLQAGRRRAADEEDVALSAFHSFCRGVEAGRFAQLADRDSLWALLLVITARKAVNQTQHELREKRGGGRVSGESGLVAVEDGPAIEEVVGHEPDPAFAAEVAEECGRLLAELEDDCLRQIALWKMEGFTNEEIAAKLGRSVPTVERKLARIRHTWLKEHRP